MATTAFMRQELVLVLDKALLVVRIRVATGDTRKPQFLMDSAEEGNLARGLVEEVTVSLVTLFAMGGCILARIQDQARITGQLEERLDSGLLPAFPAPAGLDDGESPARLGPAGSRTRKTKLRLLALGPHRGNPGAVALQL